mgnify:CR=1 FL=1
MKILEIKGPVSVGDYDLLQVNGVGVWSVLNDLGHFINSSGKKIKLSLVVEEESTEACNEQG